MNKIKITLKDGSEPIVIEPITGYELRASENLMTITVPDSADIPYELDTIENIKID